MALNPAQFDQKRLPGFGAVPLKQPHQMSPLEFAHHPDTWWHGSDSKDFDTLRQDQDKRSTRGGHQGFHVGTLDSAEARMNSRGKYHEGYLHPVRLNTEMRNSPDKPIDDEMMRWRAAHHGSYYTNDFEDRGSVSAIVRSPDEVKHYADYVHEANARGGIPSGQAQHFVTQQETHSPGFALQEWRAGQDRGASGNKLEQRPPYRSPWDGGVEVREMIRQVDTFDAEGERNHARAESLHDHAVPEEHKQAQWAADAARQQPWVDRMKREADAIGEVRTERLAKVKATSKLAKPK